MLDSCWGLVDIHLVEGTRTVAAVVEVVVGLAQLLVVVVVVVHKDWNVTGLDIEDTTDGNRNKVAAVLQVVAD